MMPLGTSPHAKQALVRHVQEAQIRASAESVSPMGSLPSVHHLPTIFALRPPLTTRLEALPQPPGEAQRQQVRGSTSATEPGETARTRSFCATSWATAGGLTALAAAALNFGITWASVFAKGSSWDRSEGLDYFSK